MNKEKLKNILTKIGEVNPEYNLEKQVYNVGGLIQFIDNPSEKVGLAAVKKAGNLIRYIQNPTEKVQLAAVKKDPYLIQFIKNPTEGVKQLHRKKTGKYITSDSISKKIITRIGKFFGSPS